MGRLYKLVIFGITIRSQRLPILETLYIFVFAKDV